MKTIVKKAKVAVAAKPAKVVKQDNHKISLKALRDPELLKAIPSVINDAKVSSKLMFGLKYKNSGLHVKDLDQIWEGIHKLNNKKMDNGVKKESVTLDKEAETTAIAKGHAKKSEKIRLLYRLGKSDQEIMSLLGIKNRSQVHRHKKDALTGIKVE